MPKPPSKLELNPEELTYLESLVRLRTIQAQTLTRARILLLKSKGLSIKETADKVGYTYRSVALCLKKYKQGGVEHALTDAPGRGNNPEITDEEKSWIINLACQKPTTFGYAAETWTYALLTKHINTTAESAGYLRLATIHKTTVFKILTEADIKPYKIEYYCENRDLDCDRKMHNVLLVYKQLELYFEENKPLQTEEGKNIHVVSYDEKPGIQAIATTSDDLPADETHQCIRRDYEYKRLGTLSLLAGIDLQTGDAIPLVSDSHTSKDYVQFLKILDERYPQEDKIRIILDNLKVHTSKETIRYFSTVPGRFEFVFTPKHGSWLNMIEGFFSKLTRQLLRGMRVKSKTELVNRLYKYFDEINEEPVVFHWKYNLDDLDVSEAVITDALKYELNYKTLY
ncbi:IS630 family transposase [Treponema phagedenis]|uniref:IS630 family transposase n=1 Tax=Treponema phagedenis TaxID=162 RepID=UPI0011EE24AC|nr:IS630 family transposase [Treponema phagedenis]TYT76454.1 IS630 family transposase [Treponema phagedenis]TYT76872.1 IS630 family transposase [Treponema phagedenis]TYT79839.1 IS630 family transposase [Treponema phagedenis]